MTAKKKKFLNKAELLDSYRRKVVEHETSRGWVRLRGLSLNAVLALPEDDPLAQTTELLRQGLVGEDGEPLYTADEARALLDGDMVGLTELALEIQRLSGAAPGAVEQAEKN